MFDGATRVERKILDWNDYRRAVARSPLGDRIIDQVFQAARDRAGAIGMLPEAQTWNGFLMARLLAQAQELEDLRSQVGA